MKEYMLKGRFHIILSMLVVVLTFASCSTTKTIRGSEGKKSSIGKVEKSEKLSKTDDKLIKEAKSWLGTMYKYGGHSKEGTDCSGFVMQVFLKVYDIKLPRSSKAQHAYCTEIKQSKMQVGDLVFFATGKSKTTVSHVGIYIGNGEFIHASSSKGVVISKLEQNYYQRTFISAGRVAAVKRKE